MSMSTATTPATEASIATSTVAAARDICPSYGGCDVSINQSVSDVALLALDWHLVADKKAPKVQESSSRFLP
jgi:hypothetical protein